LRPKKGSLTGYNGFKRISGTKIHVAVESNGLPVSIVMGPANQHDSTRLIDVMENISDCLDDDAIKEIVQCYADKGYDAEYIREYLEKRRIQDCIPYRKDSKTEHDDAAQYKYNKTRYVVEESVMKQGQNNYWKEQNSNFTYHFINKIMVRNSFGKF
jgi:transposase